MTLYSLTVPILDKTPIILYLYYNSEGKFRNNFACHVNDVIIRIVILYF